MVTFLHFATQLMTNPPQAGTGGGGGIPVPAWVAIVIFIVIVIVGIAWYIRNKQR
jgi:hypothetical protein